MPILTQRAILLVKVETTNGTDAAPVVSTDAIQIENPQFSVQIDHLERKFATRDFSTWPSVPGRKTADLKFSIELTAKGTANTAPRWARLLEACGMFRSNLTGTAKTVAASPTGAVRTANVTTFTTTAAHGLAVGNTVNVATVTDATFNGTFTVLSVPTTTTFTVANVGTNGSSGTGTVTVVTAEKFSPITDSNKSVTLYLYLDGWLHKITGSMGTYSLQADAGKFGQLDFSMMGNYVTPISGAFPTGDVYDNITPALVEYSNMSLFGASGLVASALKFDAGVDVVPRMDMNAASGYRGMRIKGRNPTGGLDPEVELTHTFWSNLTDPAAYTGLLTTQFGTVAGAVTAGQTIQFSAPAAQLINMVYGDRDNLRTYDLSLNMRRVSGDDDHQWLFF